MPLVFITGGGKRIGRGLSIEFAKKGWDVIVHYNSSEKGAVETVNFIKSLGLRSIAVKADILSFDELKKAFETAIGKIGIPDVLVNNAGVFPEATKLSGISPELWDETLGINLRGELYCSQLFAKSAGKGARIINFASLGAFEIWKHRLPYNVSKAGVIQLTKALAKELAPDISVNCVCPGAISIPEEPSITDSTLININKIPIGRYGTVKDIFDAVYFFATCSDYITGQVLTVDGGYHN